LLDENNPNSNRLICVNCVDGLCFFNDGSVLDECFVYRILLFDGDDDVEDDEEDEGDETEDEDDEETDDEIDDDAFTSLPSTPVYPHLFIHDHSSAVNCFNSDLFVYQSGALRALLYLAISVFSNK
jgi:hypothetical protein